MAAKKKHRRKLNVWRLVFVIILFFIIVGAGAGAGLLVGIARNLPDLPSEKELTEMAMTTHVYDAEGNQVVTLHGAENREWVEFEKIPSELKMAFLAIEDIRFYEHYGVDPRALARAVVANITGGFGEQGGSTITQQLAKNAFIENPTELSLKRKLQEALLAFQLERTYKKEQILEFYLNRIYFGEGAYGVQAAAKTYFGKNVQQLTLPQSAMLAGMVRSPHSRYNPYKNPDLAEQRRNLVLNNMAKYQFISEEEADKAVKSPLEILEPAERKVASSYKYPYFIDYVATRAQELLEENGIESSQLYTGGLRVYTTLDTKIQESIESSFTNKELFPPGEDDQMVQAAVAVINPATGEIKGLMGGREHVTRRGLNRAVRIDQKSGRQPGSAIKPLAVYGAALELGYAPASVIDDVPTTFKVGKGQEYSPHNYDGKYRGLISMREALRRSINIAAVKWLDKIGVSTGYEFAKSLGLPLTADDKYLSLALGGLTHGVTTLEMASAYGTFANSGIWIKPHVITRIEDSEGNILVDEKPEKRDVMSPQNAYLMTDMLQTVVRAGTGTRARLDRPTAGKTGTVQLPPELKQKISGSGTKDAWFVGYTPELAAAVWMGYDITDENHYLKGIGGGNHPAMLWKSIMEKALEGEPVEEFKRPDGVVYTAVDAKSGLLPSENTPPEYVISEIFTRKSMPREESNVWVKEKIDPITGQLANPYCPETVEKVFLKRPVPYTGEKKPEDAFLEAPTEVCTLHGPGSETAYICTNEQHTAPVLALLPHRNQEGGCPEDDILEVKLPPSQLPKAYCDIPEHQLSVSTQQDSTDNTPDDSSRQQGAEQNDYQEETEAAALKAKVEKNSGKPVVKLSWKIPDNPKNLVYAIERWQQGDREKTSLGLVEENTMDDNSVKKGETYFYRVFIVDRDTNLSAPTNEVKVKIP